MLHQRTQRIHLVLPVPVAQQQCTTGGWSTHGKHLDRGRKKAVGYGNQAATRQLHLAHEGLQWPLDIGSDVTSLESRNPVQDDARGYMRLSYEKAWVTLPVY